VKEGATNAWANTKQATTNAWANVKDSVQSAADYTYDKKSAYVAKAQADLDALDAKIKELSDKAASASGDVKADAQAKIQALRYKRAALDQKLDAARNSTESGWSDVKSAFKSSYDDVKDSFEQAWQPVLEPDHRELGEAPSQAVARLPQNIYREKTKMESKMVAQPQVVPAPDYIKPNAYCVHEDGRLCLNEDGVLSPLDDLPVETRSRSRCSPCPITCSASFRPNCSCCIRVQTSSWRARRILNHRTGKNFSAALLLWPKASCANRSG
jgi:hypothetical protein